MQIKSWNDFIKASFTNQQMKKFWFTLRLKSQCNLRGISEDKSQVGRISWFYEYYENSQSQAINLSGLDQLIGLKQIWIDFFILYLILFYSILSYPILSMKIQISKNLMIQFES
jgi:hypothetical protein